MRETSQYRYRRKKCILPPLASIIRKRVKSNTGFRRIPSRISQTRNTPSASSTPVYSQFTAPRGGNRGTSLPCNFRSFSPPSSHHPPLPPAFAHHPPSSQQPAATLSSVTLHYLPLRNVEDASFHFGARKISSAVFPVPDTSAGFIKFGDVLKLPRRVRQFPECPADDSQFPP